MIEPDWNLPRPTAEEIEAFYRQITLEQYLFEDPFIQSFLIELRKTYGNGGAELFCFKLPENNTFRWFYSRNNLADIDFLQRVLLTHDVLEPLESTGVTPLSDLQLNLEPAEDAFALDGELARILKHGGAYPVDPMKSDSEIKEMCSDFCSRLFQNRYSEIIVQKSFEQWSKWFKDKESPWNRTWFMFDKGKELLWILCLTDES